MNEVYSKETTDIKNDNIENYKDIKPNEKASLKESGKVLGPGEFF